jgi:hypothetical protein
MYYNDFLQSFNIHNANFNWINYSGNNSHIFILYYKFIMVMPITCKFKKEDGIIHMVVHYLYESGPAKYPIFVIAFDKKIGNDFVYNNTNTRVPSSLLKLLIEMQIVEYDEPFLKLTTKSMLEVL